MTYAIQKYLNKSTLYYLAVTTQCRYTLKLDIDATYFFTNFFLSMAETYTKATFSIYQKMSSPVCGACGICKYID